MRHIAVQELDFDQGALLATLAAPGDGAVASFTGIVRNNPQGTLAALTLEHYPGMTERALTRLADTALARWPLSGCVIIHRVGRLVPGAPIVFVATASAHRGAALEATAFLIDQLKTSAPFWKSESFTDGTTAWVEARAADADNAAAWDRL